MGLSKTSIWVASVAVTAAFSGYAMAQTVETKDECLAQDGTVMDLKGEAHCFVPIVPEEFQSAEYAGEIKGVHACKKENVRKTRIGDFCLIALEAKKTSPLDALAKKTKADAMAEDVMGKDDMAKMAKDVMTDKADEMVADEMKKPDIADTMTDKLTEMAKDEVEKMAKKKAEEKVKETLSKAVTGN